MNTRHQDILNAISRMMWLSTTGVAEAIEPLGYGGGKSWNDYRDMISKDLGYLKSKGLITGEDRPQTKGKPLRYWSLANQQPDCQSAEMASDVAEVESANSGYLEDIHGPIATHKENLTVADADMVATLDSLDTEREIQERKSVAETVTPDSGYDAYAKERELKRHTEVAIEAYEDGFMAAQKPHLAIGDIMDAYHQEVAEDTDQNFYSFCLGIAYAEKHHGISQ